MLAVLVLTVSASVQAQEPQKERKEPKAGERVKAAWEWTLEERLAKRLDVQQIRERDAAREENVGTPQWMRVPGAESPQYVIDGQRDPELFMPFELFVSLLRGVTPPTPGIDPTSRDFAREQYRSRIAEFGWQEELFWKTVEIASAEYLRYDTERLALRLEQIQTLPPPERRRKLEGQIEGLSHKQCVARAEALRTVRAKLGAESFDRFLYGVVAPGMALMSSDPDDASRLRFLEGGCR
ncbi:MAG TPA: hypothetical protein VKB93_00945 [Thermoanaerobaculia bacterium]|nr:hypothetical protein [Thermoanaerobaculia bacterium]